MTKTADDRFELIEPATGARREVFAEEVRKGLSEREKSLPCRFLYDAEGSRLFEEITKLPEYYLTGAEREILRENADEIAALFPDKISLAELGSGSAEKTRLLIEALIRSQGSLHFLPVDISKTILEQSSLALLSDHPELRITGFAYEYEDGLRRLDEVVEGPRLVLWLGSNIGNFTRRDALEFLLRVRSTLDPDDRLLVGIDLHKDAGTLELAYDDPQGVTASFSHNLLARINRELGGNFELDSFRHEAHYNAPAERIEIHLVSLKAQKVALEGLDMEVEFAEGEKIHTEYSYKYRPGQIEILAAESGFQLERSWTDGQGLFSENLFAPI